MEDYKIIFHSKWLGKHLITRLLNGGLLNGLHHLVDLPNGGLRYRYPLVI